MDQSRNPNEVMTPTFVGEQLVYVPLLIFYLGTNAINQYLERQQDDRQASRTTPTESLEFYT